MKWMLSMVACLAICLMAEAQVTVTKTVTTTTYQPQPVTVQMQTVQVVQAQTVAYMKTPIIGPYGGFWGYKWERVVPVVMTDSVTELKAKLYDLERSGHKK